MRARRSSAAALAATTLVPISSRRPSTPCTPTPRRSSRPTGRRSLPYTTSCWWSPPRRWWPSTAPSPSVSCRARPRRWRWWMGWRIWTTTTRSTPPEPICLGGWAGTARPRPPTSVRRPWRRPRPSGSSSEWGAGPRAECSGDVVSEHGGIGVATEPGDTRWLPAVGAGGNAEAALEGLGEGELGAVPDPEGDLRQRGVGLVQQGGGVGEAGADDVALGRLAHHLTKVCREGGPGERDLGGELTDGPRVIGAAVDALDRGGHLRIAQGEHAGAVGGLELDEGDAQHLGQQRVGQAADDLLGAGGGRGGFGAQQREGGGQPGDGVAVDAADEHPRREEAQDRVGSAALEREPAAEQPGPRPAAAVAQPAVFVGWRAGEELLELYCRGGWIVAQPMPPPGRQHDEVSGGKRDLVGAAIDLEPTGAGGDHVEGRVPVACDAKAPRRPQH